MVTVNGAHLTRPRVFDAENAFSFGLVDLFTSGRVEQNWLHTKERCGCRTRLRRGCTRKRCQHVTTSFGLPPCVNDRTCAFADNIVVPVPSFRVDRLTHGAEDAERRQVVFLNKLFAHAHQRTDRGRCSVELSNFVLFTNSPETASVWVGRNAFEHQGGAAVSERTVDDVGVASNPTHVSGTPVYVAFMVVEGVFVGHRCVDQITTGRVHNALRLTSRTRGVENEQRVFCVHRTCRALWRSVGHEVFHVNVTAINPSGLITSVFHNKATHLVRAVQKRCVTVGFQCSATTTTRSGVSSDNNLRTRVVDAVCQCVRREAREHDRVDRTDTRTSEHRISSFRDHREIDHNAVAAHHALAQQDVRETVHLLGQLIIGDVLCRLVWRVRLENDCGLVAAGREVTVYTVICCVDHTVFEPLDVDVAVFERRVLYLRVRLHPVQTLTVLTPECHGIVHRSRIHLFVFSRIDMSALHHLF